MNKKGQVEGIMYFFGIILAIIVTAVIMGFFVNTMVGKFSNSMAGIDPTANQTGQSIITKFNNTWDTAIMFVFLLNVIILLVSSFLIDIHPLFVIIYVIAIVFLIFLAPNILYAIEKINTNPQFLEQYNRMPMTKFVFDNFIMVLLGVVILSGIVMYARIKMGHGGQIGGNY